MIYAIGAALLLAGYLLGRARPWVRLADWAHDQIRYDGAWLTRGRVRQAVLLAAWAVTAPRDTLHAYRHRNDPPAALSAPVQVGPERHQP